MSDDRRGEGNGAVVAIVVVLAILIMCGGGLVLFGGLFFSFSSVAPMPAPPPVSVTSAPVPIPPADSTPSEPSSPLELEITKDGKYLLAGEELALDKLEATLKARKEAGAHPKIVLRPLPGSNQKHHQEVMEILQTLQIEFELKDR